MLIKFGCVTIDINVMKMIHKWYYPFHSVNEVLKVVTVTEDSS